MHQAAPLLLTGLGGAAIPTIGVTVLVGKNNNLSKTNSELEEQNQSLTKSNNELSGKVDRPKVEDMLDVVDKHYWAHNSHSQASTDDEEKYTRYYDIGEDKKLKEGAKCLYRTKQEGTTGSYPQTYHFHICLRIDSTVRS